MYIKWVNIFMHSIVHIKTININTIVSTLLLLYTLHVYCKHVTWTFLIDAYFNRDRYFERRWGPCSYLTVAPIKRGNLGHKDLQNSQLRGSFMWGLRGPLQRGPSGGEGNLFHVHLMRMSISKKTLFCKLKFADKLLSAQIPKIMILWE